MSHSAALTRKLTKVQKYLKLRDFEKTQLQQGLQDETARLTQMQMQLEQTQQHHQGLVQRLEDTFAKDSLNLANYDITLQQLQAINQKRAYQQQHLATQSEVQATLQQQLIQHNQKTRVFEKYQTTQQQIVEKEQQQTLDKAIEDLWLMRSLLRS